MGEKSAISLHICSIKITPYILDFSLQDISVV